MTDLPGLRKKIAGRLKMARSHAGLTQGQVAKLLEIPRPSVSEAEAGRRRVSAEELKVLADLYDVSIDWLTGERSDSVDLERDRIDLAARELSKLKAEDVDMLLKLLASMRRDR